MVNIKTEIKANNLDIFKGVPLSNLTLDTSYPDRCLWLCSFFRNASEHDTWFRLRRLSLKWVPLFTN